MYPISTLFVIGYILMIWGNYICVLDKKAQL